MFWISDLDHIINKTNKEQTIPPRIAFNSLITDEHVTKKTVIPYPVTEYSVVYSSQELPRLSLMVQKTVMYHTSIEWSTESKKILSS